MIDTRGACTRCGAQMIQEDGQPERCDGCIEATVLELNPKIIGAKVVRKARLTENPETVRVEPR